MPQPFTILATLRLFPEAASTLAPRTDWLFTYLMIVAVFFTLLISALIVGFAVKYRRSRRPAADQTVSNLKLEMLWIVIPLVLVLVAFTWGAQLFVDYSSPPPGARTVYVIGKQWMWKVYHPEGHMENNQLHVARGRPVRLTLMSDDVIHSFFVPAFRVKRDAVPGMYTTLWFEPTRTGRFDLYCAEYCGTNHSRMIGEIVVLEPEAFEQWLSEGEDIPLAEQGRRVFAQFGCGDCHSATSGKRGPALDDLFGRRVQLASGETVLADENYIRESILNPARRLVAGYEELMPTYERQLDEESVIALVAYLKSLSQEASSK